MALGIGKNTKASNGAPYLSLSYIEAPKHKTSNIDNKGRIEPLISIINDPIQNINDQVFSNMEETIEITNISGTALASITQLALEKSNIDTDKNNVKSIYRITDDSRVDNLIETGSGITLTVSGNTLILSGTAAVFLEKGIYKGNKLKITLNAKTLKKTEARKELTLDFHYLASQNFGFGVEKYFMEGTARKSIQQTRGDIIGDKVTNNFFVDTWGRAPDKIILSGVIEMPHGLDFACRFEDGNLIQAGRQVDPTENSFIGTIEEFYRNNNNPIRVNRGEILTLNDYFKGEFYIVTFKSRKFEQSVDRPNIMPWQIELIVLARTDVNSFKDESLNNKGVLNKLLNFGIG